MSDNNDDENTPSQHRALNVGEQLKAEREKLSMSLEDVASKTRVTMRHLEAIENSQYSKLPGKTYIIGFTKSYARCVGLNDAEIAAELREELSSSDHFTNVHHVESYEPASANRIPSKALAWTAAVVGFIALAALLIWTNAQLNRGADGEADAGADNSEIASNAANETQTAASAKAANDKAADEAALATGKVVLTAKGEVWLEIYDFDRKTLFENTMKVGDTFEVPADAKDPLIVTGRPDLVEFTVGGKTIKPLGDGQSTIKNVRVSAQALAQYDASAANSAPQVPSEEINNRN